VAGRGHPDHEAEDARAIAERLSGRTLTPAGVSRFWLGRAGDEIRAEPGHFVRLLAHKARLLLQPREIMDAVAFEVFADESVVLRVLGWLSFGLLAPLSLAGAVLVLGRRNAGVTLAMAGLLALSIVAFFVVGRFRLGLVPILVPLAAVASTELRSSTRRVPALAALVACGLLVAWPLATEGDPRATSASNLASELLRRNDPAGAERWARTAREQDPRSADAAYNLGLALRGQGRNDEAVEPFEAAQELEPAYAADCLAELGALRALAGDAAGARELLERALALDREHAAARRYLAALEKSQRSE
jgi:tetratricopeptide (TPR) repeat protein